SQPGRRVLARPGPPRRRLRAPRSRRPEATARPHRDQRTRGARGPPPLALPPQRPGRWPSSCGGCWASRRTAPPTPPLPDFGRPPAGAPPHGDSRRAAAEISARPPFRERSPPTPAARGPPAPSPRATPPPPPPPPPLPPPPPAP